MSFETEFRKAFRKTSLQFLALEHEAGRLSEEDLLCEFRREVELLNQNPVDPPPSGQRNPPVPKRASESEERPGPKPPGRAGDFLDSFHLDLLSSSQLR